MVLFTIHMLLFGIRVWRSSCERQGVNHTSPAVVRSVGPTGGAAVDSGSVDWGLGWARRWRSSPCVVRRPCLSLCFDRAEPLPRRRLAHLEPYPKRSPVAAQTCLGFGSANLHLPLTDLWQVALLESVGNRRQIVKRLFSNQIDDFHGISYNNNLPRVCTHCFLFRFCLPGQISTRWKRRLWRSRRS